MTRSRRTRAHRQELLPPPTGFTQRHKRADAIEPPVTPDRLRATETREDLAAWRAQILHSGAWALRKNELCIFGHAVLSHLSACNNAAPGRRWDYRRRYLRGPVRGALPESLGRNDGLQDPQCPLQTDCTMVRSRCTAFAVARAFSLSDSR